MLFNVRTITIGIAAVALALPLCAAGPEALVRIDRAQDLGRDDLLEAGIPLVAELSNAFLALGDLTAIEATVARLGLGLEVVDARPEGGDFALAGLLEAGSISDLSGCGDVLWRDDDWILVRTDHADLTQCRARRTVLITPLSLQPLGFSKAAPAPYASLPKHATELVDTDALVTEMLTFVDAPFALAHWQAIVESASTRYSTSTGCQTAADDVFALFDAFGLDPEFQDHTSGHAPNIIGTIPGRVTPDQVYIVIGHLDDMPSSGNAPGADDNASGSALVTALAEVMSNYDFSSTIRFLAVTGEEWGLYGSAHYAAQAAAAGEQIQAVLNADMVGWEGNGSPDPEDLDINYNTSSAWLGSLMTEIADDYPVGLPVNAFQCNDMAYSDHWPFWQRGFSGVCGITDNEGFCGQSGSYPYYHTSSDTIANCGPGGPEFLAGSMRLYLATAGHLAEPLCRRSGPPSDLTAAGAGVHRVDLSWTGAGPGLIYEIRRAPGGCDQPGPVTVVAETADTSLSDTTASGDVVYGYNVVAKDPSGYCLSQPTACVEASTTGSCTEAPGFSGATDVVDAGSETCLLTVNWSPPYEVYCGGSVVYNVYRSTSSGFEPGPSSLVAADVLGTSFDDVDAAYSQQYYYVVRAVDQGNGAEDLNTVEVTGSPTGPPTLGIWSDTAGDIGPAALVLETPWHIATTGGHTGTGDYRTGIYPSDTCAAATTPALDLGPSPVLEFWSVYDIEDDWDKGIVELSANGGATWTRLEVGYPGYAGNTGDQCGLPTGYYFTGTEMTHEAYQVSLAPWSGQQVRLRWRLSSDGYVEEDGWWIDDISITDVSVPGECTSGPTPFLFTDGFESGDVDGWSTVVP